MWDHSVFSKNRDRLLEHEVVEAFFTEVMSLADKRGLLSKEHFSVDGTLIQAWASHKSFRRKDGSGDGPPAAGGRNADTDWKGEPRSKQSPAILCYQGHILMENRSGLVVGAVASHADGFAERANALRLPAEQQVVAHLFHQHSLTAHRVEHLQQQRTHQLLRCNRGPADVRIDDAEQSIEPFQRFINQQTDRAQRMIGWNEVLKLDRREQGLPGEGRCLM